MSIAIGIWNTLADGRVVEKLTPRAGYHGRR